MRRCAVCIVPTLMSAPWKVWGWPQARTQRRRSSSFPTAFAARWSHSAAGAAVPAARSTSEGSESWIQARTGLSRMTPAAATAPPQTSARSVATRRGRESTCATASGIAAYQTSFPSLRKPRAGSRKSGSGSSAHIAAVTPAASAR